METSAHVRLLTGLDHTRLATVLFKPRAAAGLAPGVAHAAQGLLDVARVVDPLTMTADVVTMRSRVRLRDAGGTERVVTLVYPSEADAAVGLVSVLTPLGLALLGARLGQWLAWREGAQLRSASVAELLYQPEAAGDFAR